jgi:hypothetical protein
MSDLRIVDADPRRLERWDEHVERAVNGTLFHLRSFLAYHDDRFRDRERFLLVLDGDTVLAQLPAAVEDGVLRSPYGASYGGFAFQRQPTFAQATAIADAFVAWLREEEIERAILTPPIGACAPLPLDVVAFALIAAGFASVNRDISSVVRLDAELPVDETVSSRARNSSRKAERSGVTVETRASVDDFWRVLEATFKRHGTQPTHTYAEFCELAERLPDRVYADVAYHDGEPVAGVGYFVINRRVNSSFYLAQYPERQELNGLTACVLHGLERARQEGYRWFDFGTSTAQMQPRENIFRFKEQFGSAGQFRETFEWRSGA